MQQLAIICHQTFVRFVTKTPAVLAAGRTTVATNVSNAEAAKTQGRSARGEHDALHAADGQLIWDVAYTNSFSQGQSDIPTERSHLFHIYDYPKTETPFLSETFLDALR